MSAEAPAGGVPININDLTARLLPIAQELQDVLKRHHLGAVDSLAALRICRSIGIELIVARMNRLGQEKADRFLADVAGLEHAVDYVLRGGR